MDSLADVLWHERALLETLLFRLEEAVLLAGGGSARWWERAARDVDDVLTTVRRTEILRAMVAGETAVRAGLDPDAPLRVLATAVDPSAQRDLLEHREAIRTLSAEIADVGQRLRTSAIDDEITRVVRRPGGVASPASLESFLR